MLDAGSSKRELESLVERSRPSIADLSAHDHGPVTLVTCGRHRCRNQLCSHASSRRVFQDDDSGQLDRICVDASRGSKADPALVSHAKNIRRSGPPIRCRIASGVVNSVMTSSVAPAKPGASGPASRHASQKNAANAATSSWVASVTRTSGVPCSMSPSYVHADLFRYVVLSEIMEPGGRQ